MSTQGVLSLQDDQVEKLFGKLGTHSKLSGATLHLRDAFFTDFRGRKVTINAPSRRVAAVALRTLLFQLSTKHLAATSTWNYIDGKGAHHGPYPYDKMLKWALKDAFKDENLPVQHAELRCWMPLWFLPQLAELTNNALALAGITASEDLEDVSMEDWEATVRELNAERSGSGLLHGASGGGIKGGKLVDFPELQVLEGNEDTAAPMDYELSHDIQFDVAPDNVRACIIVDTNILLSHMTFTERVFQSLVVDSTHLEVLVLVPWVVLNELDRLKDVKVFSGSGSRVSEAARFALRKLRALTSERDTFVHAQSAVEHARMVAAGDLPADAKIHKELRNDDLILQTCLYWQKGAVAKLRAAGHRAAVFLLSNDKGLCTRAEANGVKCFSAIDLPRTEQKMANEVPSVQPVAMDEAESHELGTVISSPRVGGMQKISGAGSIEQQAMPSVTAAASAAAGIPGPSLPPTTAAMAAVMAAATTSRPLSHNHQGQMMMTPMQSPTPSLTQQLQMMAGQGQGQGRMLQQLQLQQQQEMAANLSNLNIAGAGQSTAAAVQAQAQAAQGYPGYGGPPSAADTYAALLQQFGMKGQHLAAAAAPRPPVPLISSDNTAATAAAAKYAALQQQLQLQVALNQSQQQQQHPMMISQRSNSLGSAPAPSAALLAQQRNAFPSTIAATATPSSPRASVAPPPEDSVDRLSSIVERCLGPAIKYYRQQDLGELWLDMLEESSRPPWNASTAVHVLCSHSTTFWQVLSRAELDSAKHLEKFLKSRHHHHHSANEVTSAASILLSILSGLLSGLDKPRPDGSEAPDPAEVPDFVSLGDTRGALEEGIQEVQQYMSMHRMQ